MLMKTALNMLMNVDNYMNMTSINTEVDCWCQMLFQLSSNCRWMAWSTGSKAGDRSSMTNVPTSPRSNAVKMSESTHVTAVSVKCPACQPDWSDEGKSNSRKYFSSWLATKRCSNFTCQTDYEPAGMMLCWLGQSQPSWWATSDTHTWTTVTLLGVSIVCGVSDVGHLVNNKTVGSPQMQCHMCLGMWELNIWVPTQNVVRINMPIINERTPVFTDQMAFYCCSKQYHQAVLQWHHQWVSHWAMP